ncbi:hypothetical protein ACFO3O_16115 [Dokdonia ponticola]|uniref:Entericidin A/B family lipoprotein n=1 Tax=Dokdonia ponticola TaxID=2041041 RepID=A0ABV9I100_9FLAO
MKKSIFTIIALALFTISISSCREKTTAEKAGDAVEEGIEEVTDEVDDATKK